MFSSANNNSDDPDLDSMFKRPASNYNFQLSDILIQNPISKPSDHIDHDPPFFSNFPSPFLDEYESPLNQILHHNLLMAAAAADQTHQNKDSQEYSTKKERNTAKRTSTGLSKKLKEKAVIDHNQPISRRNLGVVQRKRTGKKDRHSKICTAQGIRDRRMRLSLQVARKFFDLQDMLGYDKASKTIEWLFNKSKKAIKDLTKDHHNPQGNNKNNIINISMLSDAKSESFLSECEVVSGIEETSNNEIQGGIINLPNKGETEKTRKKTKPNLRSESREKARARARYRTIEKMMIKQLENCKSSPNQNDAQKLGSSIDQESGERVSPYDADGFTPSLMQQIADEGTIEKLLLGNSSSDPNSNFMGFLGNWELLYNDKMNSSQFAVTNQVPLAGEQLISSEYSSAATPNFPLFQQ